MTRGPALTKSPKGLSFTNNRQLLCLIMFPNKSCIQNTSSKEHGGQGMITLRSCAVKWPSEAQLFPQQGAAKTAPLPGSQRGQALSASARCPYKRTPFLGFPFGVVFQEHLPQSLVSAYTRLYGHHSRPLLLSSIPPTISTKTKSTLLA